jgi:hypothetical protein
MIGDSFSEVDDLYPSLIIDELEEIAIPSSDEGRSSLFDAESGHDVICFVVINAYHRNTESFEEVEKDRDLGSERVRLFLFTTGIHSVGFIARKELDAPTWTPISL